MSTDYEELKAQIAELQATVQRMRTGPESAETSDRPVNRRTMLRMAAAAAGGAVVAPLVTAAPAAAVQVNSLVPITPVRVWDSRNAGGSPGDGPSAPAGALSGPFNAVTPITLTLGGYRTIPSGVVGLMCVLTVITPTTGGFIRAFPGGVSAPLAVVGNYPAGAIMSFFPVVGMGTGTDADKLTVQIGLGTGVHVGLDITGYLH